MTNITLYIIKMRPNFRTVWGIKKQSLTNNFEKNLMENFCKYFFAITNQSITNDELLSIILMAFEENCMDLIKYIVVKYPLTLNYCLEQALSNNKIEFAEYLLTQGAKICNVDKQVCSIIISKGYFESFSFLFDNGYPIGSSHLSTACCAGRLDIIKKILHGYPELLSSVNFYTVCLSGNIEVVNYFIDRGFNDWSNALHGACKSGSMTLIMLILEKGATNFGSALYYAVDSSNLGIVKYIFQLGKGEINSSLIDEAIERAIEYEIFDILVFLLKQCDNPKKFFQLVCLISNKKTVSYFIDNDLYTLSELDNCLVSANTLETAIKIIDLGAKDFNLAAIYAAADNDIPKLNYLINKGANSWNSFLIVAFFVENQNLVELFVSNGATNLEELLALPFSKISEQFKQLLSIDIQENFENVLEVVSESDKIEYSDKLFISKIKEFYLK